MIKEEIENNKVQSSQEDNDLNNKPKKKMFKTKKGKIIAIVLLAYVIISIISYILLVTGDWENQEGYAFSITFRTDGIIGVKPIWILCVTRKKIIIIYDGVKYSLDNVKVVKQ